MDAAGTFALVVSGLGGSITARILVSWRWGDVRVRDGEPRSKVQSEMSIDTVAEAKLLHESCV